MNLSTFHRDERGQIAIMFGLMAVVLFGIAGFALDYTRAQSLEQRMQTALDAAVLSGVGADAGQQQVFAEKVFYENLGPTPPIDISVVFSNPASGQLSAVATAKINLTLGAIVGPHDFTVKTTSTAAADKSGKVCVLVLDPSASQALLVNSGANITAPDCEFHVRSTANPATIFNAGTRLNTKRICIKGSNIIDNGGSHPNTELRCDAADDPYAGVYPDPPSSSCTVSNANYNGGNIVLNPGTYCGWINFNNAPNVTFQPGVYVIKQGGWNVNGGNWTGNGVTFYYADQSKIQFNSAVAATLTGPSSGTYKNVVMFEKAGLGRSPFVFDDSRGFNITGLVYLPSRDATFNSAANFENKNFALVVNTLILDDTNWKIESTTAIGGGGVSNVRLVR